MYQLKRLFRIKNNMDKSHDNSKQAISTEYSEQVSLPPAKSFMILYEGVPDVDADIEIDRYLMGIENDQMKTFLKIYEDVFSFKYSLDEDLKKVRRSLCGRRLFESEKAGYIIYLTKSVEEVLDYIRQEKFHECIICAESYIQWERRDYWSRKLPIESNPSLRKKLQKIDVHKGYAWPESHQVTDDAYIIHEYPVPANSSTLTS